MLVSAVKYRFPRLIAVTATVFSATVLIGWGGLGMTLADNAPLIANGDFESGDKTGWTGYGCRTEVVTDDVHGGRYACRAWLDQDWGGGLFTSLTGPKGRYRIGMWVKIAPSVTGPCWAGADKFGGTKRDEQIRQTGAWVFVSFEITLRTNNCDLYAWGPKTAGGWILVDDVSVTPVP